MRSIINAFLIGAIFSNTALAASKSPAKKSSPAAPVAKVAELPAPENFTVELIDNGAPDTPNAKPQLRFRWKPKSPERVTKYQISCIDQDSKVVDSDIVPGDAKEFTRNLTSVRKPGIIHYRIVAQHYGPNAESKPVEIPFDQPALDFGDTLVATLSPTPDGSGQQLNWPAKPAPNGVLYYRVYAKRFKEKDSEAKVVVDKIPGDASSVIVPLDTADKGYNDLIYGVQPVGRIIKPAPYLIERCSTASHPSRPEIARLPEGITYKWIKGADDKDRLDVKWTVPKKRPPVEFDIGVITLDQPNDRTVISLSQGGFPLWVSEGRKGQLYLYMKATLKAPGGNRDDDRHGEWKLTPIPNPPGK